MISLSIFCFWVMCLYQLPERREDFPFSYFGMYKARVYPGKFHKFKFKIYRNEVDVTWTKAFDNHIISFELERLFLERISMRNRDVIDEGKSFLATVDPKAYETFKRFVNTEVVRRYKKNKAQDKIRLVVHYLYWKHLDFKTYRNPTVNKLIFDEVF